MDKFLEKIEIPHVRYADDFVVLFQDEQTAIKQKELLQTFLQTLDLNLEESKHKLAI